MRWTDILDIAIALDEQFPNQNPQTLNFVDLRQMVLDLNDFDDSPNACNERILEAIQAAWLDERE